MEIKRGVQNSDDNNNDSYRMGAAPPHYYEGDLLTSVSHALQNRPSLHHDASIQCLARKRSKHFAEGEDTPTKPNEK